MPYDAAWARRLLALIEKTEGEDTTVPIAVGHLDLKSGDIAVANVLKAGEPTSAEGPLKREKKWSAEWKGKTKIKPGETPEYRRLSLGEVSIRAIDGQTTLVFDGKNGPQVAKTLKAFFFKNFGIPVPWKRVQAQGIFIDEGEGDQAAYSDAVENEPLPSEAPDVPQQGMDTEPPDAIRASTTPPSPALAPEGSRLADKVLGQMAAHLPSLNKQDAEGETDVNLLNNWLLRQLPHWPATEQEERMYNGAARVVLQRPLGDEKDYHVELLDSAALTTGPGRVAPPLTPVRRIDLASLNSETVAKREVSDQLFREALTLAHRTFSMLDTEQSKREPIDRYVERNWKVPDRAAKNLSLTNVGNLRDEMQAILSGNPKAMAAMLGVGSKMLSPEQQTAIAEDLFRIIREVIGSISADLRTLMDVTESWPLVKENGGIVGLGGSWAKVEAINEALLTIDLSDQREALVKDPAGLYAKVRKARDVFVNVLAGEFAQQVEEPPFPGVRNGFCRQGLQTLAEPLRVATV